MFNMMVGMKPSLKRTMLVAFLGDVFISFHGFLYFVNDGPFLGFICFFSILHVNFFDSLLSLKSLLWIHLLRSWARLGALSLYMGVYFLVDQDLCRLVMVTLSTQSRMSCSLPRMQL